MSGIDWALRVVLWTCFWPAATLVKVLPVGLSLRGKAWMENGQPVLANVPECTWRAFGFMAACFAVACAGWIVAFTAIATVLQA